MRVILDTNVLLSGIFFSGPPYAILDAWRRGRVELIVSAEILHEYRRVGDELGLSFPQVDTSPAFELLAVNAHVVAVPPLSHQVCTDPDDDKFLACAIASGTKLIASGDKALLRTSGYQGVEVITPRAFVDRHLTSRN